MTLVPTLKAAALAAFLFVLHGATAEASRWGKGYVPNYPVVAHDGTTYNFYDDLIKDRVAIISFIYTTCTDICPIATARLVQLQERLREHMGHNVFIYTMTVDPDTDTPDRMRTYAETFGAGPGWLFLTGKPEQIAEIRYRLGERSTVLGDHRNDLMLSNGIKGEWQRDSAMGDLDRLVMTIYSLNPPVFGMTSPALNTNDQLEFLELKGPPGEPLYLKACAGCHSVGEGDRAGPDLAGVTQRRSKDWLTKFISNPVKMRAAKDPVALALVQKFPTVRMPPLGVSEKEAADLIAYIETKESFRRRPIPFEPLLALTTAEGKRLSIEELRDRPVAVAFGFTHCPDVCPTTLLDWSNTLASLGPDAGRIKVLFVTVDPERDTPAVLKPYMASFDPRITALTGSQSEIAAVAAAFKAHYEKVVDKDGGITFDHTIKTYILDRDGRLAGASDHRTEEKRRLELLHALMGNE